MHVLVRLRTLRMASLSAFARGRISSVSYSRLDFLSGACNVRIVALRFRGQCTAHLSGRIMRAGELGAGEGSGPGCGRLAPDSFSTMTKMAGTQQHSQAAADPCGRSDFPGYYGSGTPIISRRAAFIA